MLLLFLSLSLLLLLLLLFTLIVAVVLLLSRLLLLLLLLFSILIFFVFVSVSVFAVFVAVSVVVVDLLGRQVLSVPSAAFEGGSGRTIQIDASALSSGIYMYQIIARSQGGVDVATGTMTLIK